jgi:molybdopterin molybdotransferase
VSDKLPSIDAARGLILGVLSGRLGAEQVAVGDAVGRVLAEDLRAKGDVPPFASSAMDGYAVTAGQAALKLPLVGESRAGRPYTGSFVSGEAVRISTGAAVPKDANAVIRQEDVRVGDGVIDTLANTDVGENIRSAGGDLQAGALLAHAGAVISPNALGVIIGGGFAAVEVAKRPRVCVLATGDELRAPGEPLGPGEIHNSNGAVLSVLAARCGASVEPVARIRDDPGATEAALAEALDRCDVLLLTGGVSVGPHDHVRPALARLGVVQHLWGVALQPGKPTYFGSRGAKLVFGLPGNPVSAVVTFSLFARAALVALQGADPDAGRGSSALLTENVRRRADRERAVCVTLALRGEGTLATPTGPQESHLLSSLYGAEALAMIPTGDGVQPAGSLVALEPLIT